MPFRGFHTQFSFTFPTFHSKISLLMTKIDIICNGHASEVFEVSKNRSPRVFLQGTSLLPDLHRGTFSRGWGFASSDSGVIIEGDDGDNEGRGFSDEPG